MLPGAALAQDTIKVGILVALEGAFAAGGADGVRNVELALKLAGGKAGGKKIETVVAASDTTPATATRMARKLIEQDKVDIILGPLSGSEGIAMRDYSKTIPDKTVINGISGALETTWVDPSPNFFRYNLDGAQWGTGLGEYVVKKRAGSASRPCRPTIPSATPTSSASRSTSARLAARSWSASGFHSARATTAV
jgi:ABC-type branched-subunit amino acid transport system substrate-binding protein